jgi:hypothetical protein
VLARAVQDKQLSDEILEAVRKNSVNRMLWLGSGEQAKALARRGYAKSFGTL